MAHGRKTGGRQIGTPNKSTADARRVVSEIIDGNAHKLTEWLNVVADGIRKIDSITGKETADYVVRPNPAKAFDMLHSLLEFHVPKLSRVQVSGQETDPLVVHSNIEIFNDLLEGIKQMRQSE